MRRWLYIQAAILIFGFSICSAITTAPRSLYVSGAKVGYSKPFGNYSAIGSFEWSGGTLTASEALDPSYHFGFDIGKVGRERWYFGIGFQYTKIDLNDNIGDYLSPIDTSLYRFHQYDLNFDFNYFVVSPYQESFVPYFGVSAATGLTTFARRGFSTESKLSLALGLNIGLDVKVWQASDKRSFVTLSSINSWQLVGSGFRPRYLNIGGGIKYYFRP